ncbi:MAG: endonuclease/exonuclease/phosphatase family protein [Bryobacteraceae bacterium]
MSGALVRVVTYNVHRCRGLDGRVRADRIAEVLAELGADVIALQEVVSRAVGPPQSDQARYLATALGYHWARGATRAWRGGIYGNVVLSRFPILRARHYDLSVAWRERRGCLRVDLELSRQRRLHVFNLHLGTVWLERRRQARRLVSQAVLGARKTGAPRVVLGDFNEWTRGLVSRLLERALGTGGSRDGFHAARTYPSLLPLLRLDRIYHDPEIVLERAWLHRSRTVLIASDHLPLVAELRLPR